MISGSSLPEDSEILYSSDVALTDGARQLVQFDVESVAHMIRAAGDPRPDVWLARPEGYQADGHPLRDSESIRLIAYCHGSQTVYATDGCNACRHHLPQPPGKLTTEGIGTFAAETQVPYAMLLRLRAELPS